MHPFFFPSILTFFLLSSQTTGDAGGPGPTLADRPTDQPRSAMIEARAGEK